MPEPTLLAQAAEKHWAQARSGEFSPTLLLDVARDLYAARGALSRTQVGRRVMLTQLIEQQIAMGAKPTPAMDAAKRDVAYIESGAVCDELERTIELLKTIVAVVMLVNSDRLGEVIREIPEAI